MDKKPSQSDIIYGPILSRRIGRSLGVNLLGREQKICSYDCVYCECGSVSANTCINRDDAFPSLNVVLAAVEHALKKPRTIECITFSGNGEPTLHPEFSRIVQGVERLRNELRPQAKLAIFSNSSLITQPEVHSALELFDMPMMKLDVGDDHSFQSINRPARGVLLSDIITALINIPNLIIQSCLFDGVISNTFGQNYAAWASLLERIKPSAVHLYTICRPPAVKKVRAISISKLEDIESDLQSRFGLAAKAFF